MIESSPYINLAPDSPEWKAVRDRLIAEWESEKLQLDKHKTKELELRKRIVDFAFSHEKVSGTERVSLGNGYEAKAVKYLNYSFTSVIALRRAVEVLIASGEEGRFIASRLIKWKAELIVNEYKLLSDEHRAIIDAVLVVKEGTPTLEIVKPAGTFGL